jgi:hypothetical protein
MQIVTIMFYCALNSFLVVFMIFKFLDVFECDLNLFFLCIQFQYCCFLE